MSPLQRNPPPRNDPRPGEYSRRLGLLRLHLNDLDDLMRLLKGRTGEVSLKAGDAIADEPADLRDADARELRAVSLITNSPAVVVNLQQSDASARTTDSADDAKLLVDDVYGLLRVRHSPLVGFSQALRLTAVGVAVVAAGLGFFVVFAAVRNRPDVSASDTAVGASMILTATWVFLVVWAAIGLRSSGSAVIVPERRSDQRGLTRQARREWTLGIATFALGAVVSVALTYWQLKS